jgi:hypothetical protein
MGNWRRAGRILQGLREGRGWSVSRLAFELDAQAKMSGRALGISRDSLVRMIYDWEAGAHRPRDYYQLFILLYATQDELQARTVERGSELDRLMAALQAMGVPMNRRKFLFNSAVLAAGLTGVPAAASALEGQERLAWVLKHPRSVDLPTVAYLRATALDLHKRYEARPSTSLLPPSARQLEQVTLLGEHAPDGRVCRELALVEAHSATLMGRLLWDMSGQRDHATAARYYERAIEAAKGAKEGWAEAFPRMFQRFLPIDAGSSDPKRGLRLAEKATEAAADGSSRVVAGWSFGFLAEAHAVLGEERAAKQALDRADLHLTRVVDDDVALGVFGREQLGGFVGVCHLRLKDAKAAERALRETVLSLGLGKEKHRSVVLGDLATAFVLQGVPEQASRVLHEAVDLVEVTRSAAGMRRVFTAGRQLAPWRSEPFVQELQDRLLALSA